MVTNGSRRPVRRVTYSLNVPLICNNDSGLDKPGEAPPVTLPVTNNNSSTAGGEREDDMSKPYRSDAFIAKSKFTPRIAQAVFPKKSYDVVNGIQI
jgi:hypothetical protein